MTRTNFVIAAALVAAGSLQVAAQQPTPADSTVSRVIGRAVDFKAAAPRLLPGTRADVLTTIQGNALDPANGALPNSTVRLRDARFGRILGSQVTDRAGLFAFHAVDPGSYVVEIMGANDSTVLAASQLINVNAGEAVSAVVKLPFRTPPFAGLLGNTTSSAVAIALEAAAAGVLATTVAGNPISPIR
jgi:hypothetical protein